MSDGNPLNPGPESDEDPGQEEGGGTLEACATCGELWPADDLNENGDCPECASGEDDEEDEEELED